MSDKRYILIEIEPPDPEDSDPDVPDFEEFPSAIEFYSDFRVVFDSDSKIIETGFWCETEGLYFTDEDEHAPFDPERGGPIGHFGYPCRTDDDGPPSTHFEVVIVPKEGDQ